MSTDLRGRNDDVLTLGEGASSTGRGNRWGCRGVQAHCRKIGTQVA